MSEVSVYLYIWLVFSFLPGLTNVPQVLKMEISFSPSDPNSYKKYTNLIDNFLKAYDPEQQKDSEIDFESCDSE